MNPKRPLQNIENNDLQQTLTKMRHLQHLDKIVKQLLEPPLNQHCWVANYRDSCLIIGSESANWLFYLRFQQQQLLEKCLEYPEFSELKSIEFYIKPENSEKPLINEKPSFNLTAQSSQTLMDAAAVTSEPKLKEIFTKLAKNINNLIG